VKKNLLPHIVLIIGLLFSFSFAEGQGIPESQHYKLEKLSDGIFTAIHNSEGGYAICNAGIIDQCDKTIVIDPFFSPAAARDLKKHAGKVQRLSDRQFL